MMEIEFKRKKLEIIISGGSIFPGSFFLTLGLLGLTYYYVIIGSALIFVAFIPLMRIISRKSDSKVIKKNKRYTKNGQIIKESLSPI